MRRWNKLNGIIGIIIVFVGIGLFFFWEFYGRENYLFVNVVAPAHDIKRGDIINSSSLKIIKVQAENVVKDPIVNPKDIIGLETKQFIPKNSQLVHEYFDKPEFVSDKDQFIFPVPTEWIKSLPSSIRRHDIATFYVIDPKVSNSYSTAAGTIDKNKVGKAVISAVVAFVKDNANREVVTVGSNDRYDGSSQINKIEIIASIKQVNTLHEYVQKGCQFLVLYKD